MLRVRYAAFLLALIPVLAGASAQRTFVSGLGSDSNPCSLVQPCRQFARALTQTISGGEIVVLDSAGYGSVVITQSVTIEAPPGVYAGIAVFSGDGVSINGANIVVVLRGLSINGQGGVNGIDVIDAGTVHVEGCVISNMYPINAAGIQQLAGALEVKDTIVRNNTYGMFVQGPGSATLDRVRIEANATGLAASGGGRVSMQDSLVTNNSNIGIIATSSTFTTNSVVVVTRSSITFNLVGVYLAPGAISSEVFITDSVVSNNASMGVAIHGASLFYATRTHIVRNSGAGIALFVESGAFPIAQLDSNNVWWNSGSDIDSHGSGEIFTRGNNDWGSVNGTPSITVVGPH